MATDHINPQCETEGHNWQPWFHHASTDRLTRVCARWNCEGREVVTEDGVLSNLPVRV